MTHHQICFTRVSGRGSNDGWQAINISPELPQSAISSFTRFQNGNITPPVFDDEDASSQIVLELQCDEESVYLTHIEYNANVDDKGRQIMFAHSFVFSLNEFVKNYQDALCLDSSNFRFSIEDTMTCPPQLSRRQAVPLKDCVDSLGLSAKAYADLIQCVYYILDGKAKNSLHIICDCTEETIYKYMVCIYAALPFEFRKKISFSTYEFPNGTVKTIIFDRKIKNKNNYYIIASTQENNVLSDAVSRRLSKFEFMRIAPDNYDSEAELDIYFEALAQKLDMFGSAQTTSLELYKIAHDLLLDEHSHKKTVTPDFLSKRLNELLSAPINHPYIDQQIQYVLSDIIEFHVELNDVLSEKLCRKLEATSNRDLLDCGYSYNCEKIKRMSVEEGAKYLYNAYTNRNSESFIQVKRLLDESEHGRKILDYLYVHLIADQLPIDKKSIVSFYNETTDLSDRRAIKNALYKISAAYARMLVGRELNPDRILYEIKILLDCILKDSPEACLKVNEYVRMIYWDSIDYGTIEYNSPKTYDQIYLESSSRCQTAFDLMSLYEYFVDDDSKQFYFTCETLFSTIEPKFTAEEKKVVVERFVDLCIKNSHAISDTSLDIWLYFADYFLDQEENPIRFLMKNQIRPLLSCFNEAYQRSEILQSDLGYREQFVEWVSACVQDKAEYSKAASEALRIIHEDEKRIRQEQKKQERADRKESKGSAAKGSRFSGISNLFKKKNDHDKNDGGC